MVRYGKKSQEVITAVVNKIKKSTKKTGQNLKEKIIKGEREITAGLSKTIQKVKNRIKSK